MSEKRSRNIKVGKVYEVKTFAGVNVYVKITGKYHKDDSWWKCILLRSSDIIKLKEAGVAYSGNEAPEECESVLYEWHIIREKRRASWDNNNERNRSKDTKDSGGTRRASRRRGGSVKNIPKVVHRKRKS